MQAYQIGEAHAAVHLRCSLGDEFTHLTDVRLSVACGQARFFGNVVQGVGRVPDHCPAWFQSRRHFGAHVLDCLEGRDGTIELFSLPGVFHRLVEHVLGSAQGVGGKHDAPGVDDACEHLWVGAQEPGRCVGENEFAGWPRFVDGRQRLPA